MIPFWLSKLVFVVICELGPIRVETLDRIRDFGDVVKLRHLLLAPRGYIRLPLFVAVARYVLLIMRNRDVDGYIGLVDVLGLFAEIERLQVLRATALDWLGLYAIEVMARGLLLFYVLGSES